MLSNLDFADNTILTYFFLVFLIIDLQSLILAVIAQMSHHIAKLLIPIGIASKEEKAEFKTHPPTVEAKIRKS